MRPIKIEDGRRVAGYRCGHDCTFVVLRPRKAKPGWHRTALSAMAEHERIIHGPVPPASQLNYRSKALGQAR